MVYAGIDIGSVNTAVTILKDDHILSHLVMSSETEMLDPLQIINLAMEKAGLAWCDIHTTVATGRGRSNCKFAKKQSSDVVCQARGASHLFPSVRTIINIGAEISRAISLNDHGKVQAFATNDKCAAGSGLFLESMAHLMDLNVSSLGQLALAADSPEDVSSRCAVFAESEIISHIHRGVPKERILAGLHLLIEQITGGRLYPAFGRGLHLAHDLLGLLRGQP